MRIFIDEWELVLHVWELYRKVNCLTISGDPNTVTQCVV
jgi:hypothetical protein